MKMTKQQRAANALIIRAVEDYRLAAKAKRNALDNLLKRCAFQMQMDRASGALDVLHELFPTLPAWKDTKWIH